MAHPGGALLASASPIPPLTHRKLLGAYYTDSDVARYLSTSTLLPWLTDGCRIPDRAGMITAEEAVTANRDLLALVLEWLASHADEEQVSRLWRRLDRVRVLDPTCGDGAFLATALHLLEQVWERVLARLLRLGAPEEAVALGLLSPGRRRRAVRQRVIERNLFGVDLDRKAVEACRVRLQQESDGAPRVNLVEGNAVTGRDWSAFSNAGAGFDVILGNPPFVQARHVDYRPAGFRTRDCPNVYAWVVERSLSLLADDGRLGMVMPVSAVSGPDYRPLAELYLRHHCWISTFSNRPAKLFEGVEQRLALLITAPAHRGVPRLRTTAYQHWYEEERPQLFARLQYTRGVLHEGRPAKLGTREAVSAFSRLKGAPLSSWSAPGAGEVWLHNGPTYWVRALPFRPNAAFGASSHYRVIPTRTAEDAAALAAVLSSSTFYFWFKAVSNCRDLGRREWETFPMGKISDKKRGRLVKLGRALAERLRSTSRERCRTYPGGPVRYEEYYPGQAVDILDRIDRVLATHFDFTQAEADYVRQLDRNYRIGG